MAGNTAVMKHDPHVPGCAAAIEEAFRAVGAPEGVFQTLHAATEDVERVIRDPRIQAVSFTGSDRAGSLVASIAASEIKPAVLELGGSDRSEEHTSELQSRGHLVCRLLLEKKHERH